VTRSLCGFSGTEAVPEEVKHEGDVTEDGRGAIGFGTGTGGGE